MARKRVHALRRGPDGSAFQKCESCGLSVPVALDDMHDCEIKKSKTRFDIAKVKEQRIQDQPRSAFRFFMEDFTTTFTSGNEIEIENEGFEKWKSMSRKERLPFCLRADEVNSAYVRLLRKEEREMQWVDDEADSAEVGKYDERYGNYYDLESSDGLGFTRSDAHSSFYSEDSYDLAPFLLSDLSNPFGKKFSTAFPCIVHPEEQMLCIQNLKRVSGSHLGLVNPESYINFGQENVSDP